MIFKVNNNTQRGIKYIIILQEKINFRGILNSNPDATKLLKTGSGSEHISKTGHDRNTGIRNP